MEQFLSAIPTVGFPIVCAMLLFWFIYRIYCNTTEYNKVNLEQIQARCLAREEVLYKQIEKAQEINNQAISTITLYAERLETIQADVKEIKEKLS